MAVGSIVPLPASWSCSAAPQRAAIAVQPTRVSGETGTTDAGDGTELDACRQTLQAGLERLRASKVEGVCMDRQFALQTDAVINFDRYESVLRAVTDANEVPLFRRPGLMPHGAESGLVDLGSGDHDARRRVASRLYDWIGWAVADGVARGVHPAVSAPPARSGRHP